MKTKSYAAMIHGSIQDLDAMLALVEEAQRAGRCLRDRLETVEKGVPVRDLDEAQSAWETALAAIKRQ